MRTIRLTPISLFKLNTSSIPVYWPLTAICRPRFANTMAKPINLQLGWPSKSLFPIAALHEASTATLLDPAIAGEALVYGPDAGYQPLRESLATWLTAFYQPSAGAITSDRIYVGNGASFTLDAILAKFTDPKYTKKVFMIEPTYFLACPILEDAGFQGRLRGVPEDEEGIDVEFLRKALEEADQDQSNSADGQRSKNEHYPRLYTYIIYCVPTFSNPSAKVMSLRRRKELVQLARQHDALIITDDVYDMLRWPLDSSVLASDLPPPPPRIVDLDREMPGQTEFGNSVSNGSFSKIVGPGIRVGWVEGAPKFVSTLQTHGATKSGGSPGHMASVFIDHMLRCGSMDKHISEVLVPTYRKRYAVLMESVQKYLEPIGVRVTTGQAYEHDASSGSSPAAEAGGFFTYISLPDDLQPAQRVAKTAFDLYGLKFAHGGMMVVAGDAHCLERAKTSFGRGARLSWAWHDEEEIREGIKRLAQVMKDMRAGTLPRKQENSIGEGLDLE